MKRKGMLAWFEDVAKLAESARSAAALLRVFAERDECDRIADNFAERWENCGTKCQYCRVIAAIRALETGANNVVPVEKCDDRTKEDDD